MRRVFVVLYRAAGSGGGGPSPLEIEAAEMSGDIDNFADEEKTRDETRFHGFAGELARVDTACRDFRFFVAFRGARSERPGMELLLESGDACIGVVGGSMKFEPACGEAIGEKFLQGFAGGSDIAARRAAQWGGGVTLRSEIEVDGLAFFPVGRNL